METNDKTQTLQNYKNQKKYTEAILFFKQEIAPEISQWHYSHKNNALCHLLYCLRKTKQSEAGLKYYFGVLKMPIADYKPLKHELVWNFVALIKNNQYDQFRTLAQSLVLKLNQSDDNFAFTAFFFHFTQTEMNCQTPDYETILEIFEKIDPQKLNTEKYDLNITNKNILLPSELEKYFVYYTKLLFRNQLFEKCIQITQKTDDFKSHIDKNSLYWIKRTAAFANFALGKKAEAIEIMMALINQKKHWFMYYDLYKIVPKEHSQKINFLALSLFYPGIIDYKIKIIEEISSKNYFPESLKIQSQQLAQNIRNRNQWKTHENPISDTELKQVFISYLNNWIDYLLKTNKLMQGKILKILHDGKYGDGFILANEQTYYFKTKNIINSKNFELVQEEATVYAMTKKTKYKGKVKNEAYAVWLIINRQLQWQKALYPLKKIN